MERFKRVGLGDREILESLLLSLEPCSCEMNFLNIYTWQEAYDTHWCIWDGFPVVWFKNENLLLFPGGKNTEKMPPVSLLKKIVLTLHEAGYPVLVNQVPETYLQIHPEYEECFTAEPMAEEYGEYLYSVEKLVELRGGKLAKKKNLISQFKRLYPDYEVRRYTPDQMKACQELAFQWSASHERDVTERHEENALQKTLDFSGVLGAEGLCLYAGGTLVAFSFWTRLDSETCDEHYEKADPSFKGSAQVVNQESMFVMSKQYRYVNREQDLGLEGLRHSKLSYVPETILRNWNLILKEGLSK